MKAGPGTLAEVLVVGTDAFQEARAALNHLPGQGAASQVRARRAAGPHGRCPGHVLLWSLMLSLILAVSPGTQWRTLLATARMTSFRLMEPPRRGACSGRCASDQNPRPHSGWVVLGELRRGSGGGGGAGGTAQARTGVFPPYSWLLLHTRPSLLPCPHPHSALIFPEPSPSPCPAATRGLSVVTP